MSEDQTQEIEETVDEIEENESDADVSENETEEPVDKAEEVEADEDVEADEADEELEADEVVDEPTATLEPAVVTEPEPAAATVIVKRGHAAGRLLVAEPPKADKSVIIQRSILARRSTDKPQTARERKIAGDLPEWEPLPPGEVFVHRAHAG